MGADRGWFRLPEVVPDLPSPPGRTALTRLCPATDHEATKARRRSA
ncbi:hypothetical protein [Streptomyces sp. SID11385]|nr:hypothetical protein [Streptomyces sp. SID11385]